MSNKKIISKESRLNRTFKIIYVVLFSYIFLVPFYYLPYIVVGNLKLPLLKYFPLLLIFLLLSLSLYNNKDFRWSDLIKDRLSVLVAISFIFTLLSGILTFYYPVSAMKAFYYFLTGAMVYYILLLSKFEIPDIEFILKAFIIIGGISSIYGIICFILGKDIIFSDFATLENIAIKRTIISPLHEIHLSQGRISSTIGNPHFLGTFLSFVFPISIYYSMNSVRKIEVLIFKFFTIAIFIAILLTFSTGAYLTAAILLIYIFSNKKTFSVLNNYRKIRNIIYLFLALLIFLLFLRILGFVLCSQDFIPLKKMGKIDITSLVQLDRFTLRLDSLKLAFNSCIANYGFGIGIGIIARGLSSLYRDNLDNFYCTALAEYGLIPAIVMFFAFFYFLRKTNKAIKKKAGNIQLNVILLISFV